MLKEYTVDASAIPVKPLQRPYIFPGWPNGVVMQHQMYFAGDEDPGASCACFPDQTGSDAHFHLSSQFQLVVEGAMKFPDHEIAAPAVHYTDHCVPYGPFTVSGGHKMLVLRPRRKGGAQVFMKTLKDHKELRTIVNRSGRYFVKCAEEVPWEPAPGVHGAKRKALFSVPDGPAAEIVACPPGAEYRTSPAPFGQFQAVLRGSIVHQGKQLGVRSLRYVEGDRAPSPLQCGPQGATIALLTFDRDALWSPPEGIQARA